MASIEHVVVGAVGPGMPVVAGQVIGHVEEVILRPNGVHVETVVTRTPEGRRVAIPVDALSHIDEQGRLVLRIDTADIADLPGHVPTPAPRVVREWVQRQSDEPSRRTDDLRPPRPDLRLLNGERNSMYGGGVAPCVSRSDHRARLR